MKARRGMGFWLPEAERESGQNWEEVLRDLWRWGVRKVWIFCNQRFFWPGGGRRYDLSEGKTGSFCALHTVRDVLKNQAQKKDRGALAKDLKAVYQAAMEGEADEVLKKLRERWGIAYLRMVACWEAKAYALLTFIRYPWPIRGYLYTIN
ncbi:MAG: transposase [Candidatus Methanomethylicaceae archaeon]